MGYRALRSSILQPITDLKALQSRLDAVSNLIAADKTTLIDAMVSLKEIPDLDRLLSNLLLPTI